MKYTISKQANEIQLIESDYHEGVIPMHVDTLPIDAPKFEQRIGELIDESELIVEEHPIPGYEGIYYVVARLK